MHAVGVFFVLIAVGVAGYTAWESCWARASRTWPSVFGTITESKIERDWNRPGLDANDTLRPPDENAKIEYHYEVNGQIYWGGRVAYNDPGGFLAARRTVARYPRGQKVRVAYDPADPRRCVLEPGFRRKEIGAAVGFVALALIIGLVLLIV